MGLPNFLSTLFLREQSSVGFRSPRREVRTKHTSSLHHRLHHLPPCPPSSSPSREPQLKVAVEDLEVVGRPATLRRSRRPGWSAKLQTHHPHLHPISLALPGRPCLCLHSVFCHTTSYNSQNQKTPMNHPKVREHVSTCTQVATSF